MNKACILYSSRTGNTRSVAEHLSRRFDLPLLPVQRILCQNEPGENIENVFPPEVEESTLLILGFWTWRGGPDPAMKTFMRRLQGRRVFVFGTMAAWPDAEHAARCRERLQALLDEGGNSLEGSFFCQGRLDPEVRENSRHPMTPERQQRLDEAEKHPDKEDMYAAEQELRLVLERFF